MNQGGFVEVHFNRVPLAYFVTSGYGDTDSGGGIDPSGNAALIRQHGD